LQCERNVCSVRRRDDDEFDGAEILEQLIGRVDDARLRMLRLRLALALRIAGDDRRETHPGRRRDDRCVERSPAKAVADEANANLIVATRVLSMGVHGCAVPITESVLVLMTL